MPLRHAGRVVSMLRVVPTSVAHRLSSPLSLTANTFRGAHGEQFAGIDDAAACTQGKLHPDSFAWWHKLRKLRAARGLRR
jgi:hypothetical protein